MQVTARLYLREAIGKLGLAPLTSMFTFGENQPGPRRLPARGARLRRPVDPARRRRVDLAPARQPAPPARHLVRHDQPARLRPDAARPRARELRGSRGALRAAAERLDRADRQLGRRPRRAGADPDARRDQRQHRRLLGAAGAAGAPASRSTSPTGCAGRLQARCLPARAGSCRRGAGAASPRKPDGDIQYVVDFDGPALRSLAAPSRRRAGDLGRRQCRSPRTKSFQATRSAARGA